MSPTPLRVIGYVRVSTNKQEIGPAVQILDLQLEAERLGWDLDLRREDAASAKSLKGRPVLQQALLDLREHRADMLAVSKLDRLSRSVADFSAMLADAGREGWHIACLDLRVDTSTTMGRGMAHIAASFAQMERERISERTKEGLARVRASGKHIGRPRAALSPELVDRAIELYGLGLTLDEVADQLAQEKFPTPAGGRWWGATVGEVLERAGVARRPRGPQRLTAA